MTVLLAIVMGLAVGAGVFLVIRAFMPAQLTIAGELAAMSAGAKLAANTEAAGLQVPRRSLRGRLRLLQWVLGERLARGFVERGRLDASLRSDLSVLGRSTTAHFARKVQWAAVGLLGLPVVALLLAVAGWRLPILVPLWAALLATAAGFVAPDVMVRRAAVARREDFRSAVSAYLFRVAMQLAGGRGLAEGLSKAAEVGSGPAFRQIRGALADAATDGLSPATALGRLGEELQVKELVDTSNRLQLVENMGAQAESSLQAQAAAMLDRQLTDMHGKANEQSQTMLVAQAFLLAGFLLFIGYPALTKVLAS